MSPHPWPIAKSPIVFIVDDDANVRAELRNVLEAEGRTVEDHASSEAFLRAYRPGRPACLLIDAYLPGLSGLDLLRRLRARGDRLPAIMITGHSDVHMAVEAMRAGASDFIEKPVARGELLASIERAFEQSSDSGKAVGVAGGRGQCRPEPYPAATANHGDGDRRPPQQEHRCRSGDQPAHR